MSRSVTEPLATKVRRFRAYPTYRDSGIEWLGEVPAHWEVRRLRSTVTGCQNGVWGEEPDGVHDVACVRVADFDRVTFRVDMADPTLRSIEPGVAIARGLHAGDLLLEKSGGGENQPVGAVVLYDHTIPAVCSNFIARMTVADGYDPRFLTYLHAALYALRINTCHIKQSTGIQNLDSASYLSEATAFPLVDEQRAIAAFLDRETAKIDALVVKKERVIELLQEKRTALITQAVTKGLDPNVPMKDSSVEWLGDIPRHWKVCALRHVIRGGTRNGLYKSPEYYQPDGTPMIQMGEAFASPVVASCASDRLKLTTAERSIWALDEGDLLFARRSLVFEGSGKCSIVGELPEPHVFESSLIRVRPDKKRIVPNFLFLFLQSSVSRAQILAMTKKVTISGIDSQQLKAVCVVVPPKQEQRAIVDFIRAKDAEFQKLIDKVHQAIDLLCEFRSAQIAAAVTGKIDVREEVA